MHDQTQDELLVSSRTLGNEDEECIPLRSRLAAASSCEHGSCTIIVLQLSSRKAFCHSFHVPLE